MSLLQLRYIYIWLCISPTKVQWRTPCTAPQSEKKGLYWRSSLLLSIKNSFGCYSIQTISIIETTFKLQVQLIFQDVTTANLPFIPLQFLVPQYSTSCNRKNSGLTWLPLLFSNDSCLVIHFAYNACKKKLIFFCKLHNALCNCVSRELL